MYNDQIITYEYSILKDPLDTCVLHTMNALAPKGSLGIPDNFRTARGRMLDAVLAIMARLQISNSIW